MDGGTVVEFGNIDAELGRSIQFFDFASQIGFGNHEHGIGALGDRMGFPLPQQRRRRHGNGSDSQHGQECRDEMRTVQKPHRNEFLMMERRRLDDSAWSCLNAQGFSLHALLG
jgi:hypothetical protein